MSDSLRPHGLQHSKLPCPSLTPRICWNSCPLSGWYHPIISSSVSPFSCLHSFPASVFSNELALCIRWLKYWNFSLSPSNEYSGLISFRTDWFDVLTVQGTLKSPLQHHRLKASVLQHSAFFMVQLTSVHDYWKNHGFDYTDLCQQSVYRHSIKNILFSCTFSPFASSLAFLPLPK